MSAPFIKTENLSKNPALFDDPLSKWTDVETNLFKVGAPNSSAEGTLLANYGKGPLFDTPNKLSGWLMDYFDSVTILDDPSSPTGSHATYKFNISYSRFQELYEEKKSSREAPLNVKSAPSSNGLVNVQVFYPQDMDFIQPSSSGNNPFDTGFMVPDENLNYYELFLGQAVGSFCVYSMQGYIDGNDSYGLNIYPKYYTDNHLILTFYGFNISPGLAPRGFYFVCGDYSGYYLTINNPFSSVYSFGDSGGTASFEDGAYIYRKRVKSIASSSSKAPESIFAKSYNTASKLLRFDNGNTIINILEAINNINGINSIGVSFQVGGIIKPSFISINKTIFKVRFNYRISGTTSVLSKDFNITYNDVMLGNKLCLAFYSPEKIDVVAVQFVRDNDIRGSLFLLKNISVFQRNDVSYSDMVSLLSKPYFDYTSVTQDLNIGYTTDSVTRVSIKNVKKSTDKTFKELNCVSRNGVNKRTITSYTTLKESGLYLENVDPGFYVFLAKGRVLPATNASAISDSNLLIFRSDSLIVKSDSFNTQASTKKIKLYISSTDNEARLSLNSTADFELQNIALIRCETEEIMNSVYEHGYFDGSSEPFMLDDVKVHPKWSSEANNSTSYFELVTPNWDKNVKWDELEDRSYESGIDRGMLYLESSSTVWSGLVSSEISPEEGGNRSLYLDGVKRLTIPQPEYVSGSIEAFSVPRMFYVCEGKESPFSGLYLGQQLREKFSYAWRSFVTSPTNNHKRYKIHIVYNALISSSKQSYETLDDSGEAPTRSWDFDTTPVLTSRGIPVSYLSLDSEETDAVAFRRIESILYGYVDGSTKIDPRLPSPEEIMDILEA